MGPKMAPSVVVKPTLKQLQTKLKSLHNSFNVIVKFKQDFKDDTTANQITVRLTRLEDLWEKIIECSSEVECHEDFIAEEENPFTKERLTFEDDFFDVKSFLLDKAKERQEESNLDQSSRNLDNTQAIHEHVRLPQINLKKFDGNIDDWFSFRDLFSSLIHWKTELPEVEKFHYLKGCLEGEAWSLIDGLKVTKKNYQVAWDLLLKKYNNSKLLKKRQVHNLFKLPVLAKESLPDLHKLLESFERTVQSLDQIVEPADYRNLLLVDILSSRLDPYTRRGWEEFTSLKEEDTLANLTEFIQRRITVLESLPPKSTESKQESSQGPKKKSFPVHTSNNAVQSTGLKCPACSEPHYLHTCETFQKMSINNRESLIRNHSLCRNCFRSGHLAKKCKSKYSCWKCKKRHHTMLCYQSEDGSTQGQTEKRVSSDGPSTSRQTETTATTESVSSNAATGQSSSILLATAVVLIEDNDGNTVTARALLDSGSECNFIAERLYQRLNVSMQKVDISVVGIGQSNMRSKRRVQAVVKSRASVYAQEMSFLVLPKVTVNLPTVSINTRDWNIPDYVELADPTFFHSRAVDLVLGIQHFFNFFQTGKAISLGNGLPRLTESVFGWVVSGEVSSPCNSTQITCNMAISDSMEELMSRFWSCEEVGTGNIYSPEEARCEEQYERSVHRAADGRYTVGLPKNEQNWVQLGESRTIATRRLLGLERRLAQDAALRTQYQDFMTEYLELGHMRKVDAEPTGGSRRCFLPHHPVVREESTTTKVRVVFDASAKTSTGVSLNDVLLVGPTIQPDLRDIVLRSRMRHVMVVSDVEKMFRQINMAPADSPYQSILYRFNPEEEIATYELTTVTYGTKPAPFLATRTLKQLAQDEQQRFPLAAQALATDVYMDDVISGADDVVTATELRAQLDGLLSSGGFKLRKWASNEPSVLQGVPRENLALPDEIDWNQEASVNTLGLKWLPKTDCFRFNFKPPAVTPGQPLTKQLVLSIIATFFDPLGLLGATLVTLKMFMQRLWTLEREDGSRFDWKDPLPPTVGEEWKKLSQHLGKLNNIRIPRCVVIKAAVDIQIHCYTDASEKAYGACVYIRSKNAEGKVARRLLTSKSKVAPLKQQPLPRLELNGADLGAALVEWVVRVIGENYPVYFWTDSTCVLLWLKKPPSYWQTYVGNRVARIQRITEALQAVWNHIPGVNNPADLISRGVPPDELEGNEMWEKGGPDWNEEEPDGWPAQPDLTGEEAPERRRVVVACVAAVEFIDILLSRFSSYTTLIRTVALARRFILRGKKEEVEKKRGFLTTDELRAAELAVVRLVQQECFAEEIEDLSDGKSVSNHSRLRWFNPRIDEHGVLRVGGRLHHSAESHEAKHPMVLPAKHKFTELLFRYHHLKLLHAGPQLILASIRTKFWPLGGKNFVRMIVHKCKTCYCAKPTSIQQQMGDLPKARVTASRPFSETGVDYFGPVYVKAGRGRAPTKAYVALFVCMATKAVHMELVTDLSTECFLQALRRFIARRNRPTDIYSDNGANFVGAKNLLEQLLKQLNDVKHHEKIARECEFEGIRWHFNPPSAPHFGGLWEAAVKSAKHHLLRVLGENSASFEDYNTLLTQVEACMNSRPLIALSNDPTDLEPLTPGHFLTGASLQALPEPDYGHIPGNRLNRWQLVQRQTQDFWKRWRREYLSQLQSRTKNWQQPTNVEVGKLVIIVDNNQPPMRWKMGRIHELHPGEDGVVRVVTVKTASSLLQRPVAKLCILPSQEEAEEEPSVQPLSATE